MKPKTLAIILFQSVLLFTGVVKSKALPSKIIPQLASLFKASSSSESTSATSPAVQEKEVRLLNDTTLLESRGVCDCGIQQYVPHRIYGGTETFPNEYPWMAALVFPPGSVSCGASLISPTFALTAAHCFLMQITTLYVVLGAHDLRLASTSAIAVPVRQVIVNPNFNRVSGDYDLALVEFAYPVSFGPNISPICLPFPNLDLTWRQVVVMGWGLTQFAPVSYTLQEVTLTVVPNDICQVQYTTSGPLTQRMLCAWGDGKDACRGDSGGPLIWNSQGRWYVAGVVSFGMECGTSTAAGVYTRVDMFLDWIQSETENTACLAPAEISATMQYPWLISRSTSSQSTMTTSGVTTGVVGR